MSFILFIVVVFPMGIALALLRSDLAKLAWRVDHLETRLADTAAVPIRADVPSPESGPPEPAPSEPAPPEPGPSAVPEPVALICEPDTPTAPAALPEPEAEPEPEPEPEMAPARTAAHHPNMAGWFEDMFGRRLPIWAGGVTLAIAGVLIVRYAIDIGLFGRIFTPFVQVICGLLFGCGLIAGAEWAHARADRVADPRVAQALSGAGIATLYAAVLIAVNAYHIISPLTGFAALAGVTVAALGLSLRHGAPSALLGLISGLAAPALTVGLDANVPMLAVYLGLTIAGLAGVARIQRWPWLTLAAILCGSGWSLWLILAGMTSNIFGNVPAVLSLGGFVLLLAIAIPILGLPRNSASLLRIIAALAGTGQLALLVAIGKFQPLHWGLFALIAAAGQWLAWRERQLAIIPGISAALTILLLLIWPEPPAGWLIGIGVAMAVIHLVPLYARLWREVQLHRAIELAAIAAAMPCIALAHATNIQAGHNMAVAISAVAGSLLAGMAVAMGWRVKGREDDERMIILLSISAVLAPLAAWFACPHWQIPLWTGASAAVLLGLAPFLRDRRIEPLAASLAAMAILLLGITDTPGLAWPGELQALLGWNDAPVNAAYLSWLSQHLDSHGWACLRWAGVAVLGLGFAWRAGNAYLREAGQAAVIVLAYGALAQILPAPVLPILAPGSALLLAWAGRLHPWPAQRGAGMMLAVLTIGWMVEPLLGWLFQAEAALIGTPMAITTDIIPDVLRRLLVPAVLWSGALWILWRRLPYMAGQFATFTVAISGTISLHCLYRIGFAKAFGNDFATTGLAERLIWCAILIGIGLAMAQRKAARTLAPLPILLAVLHLTWFSLLLYNPLWSRQAVGTWPLVNALAPLCVGLPLCLFLLERLLKHTYTNTTTPARDIIPSITWLRQLATMAMVALFGWASLRQAFHGTWLANPGLSSLEDILRSLLGVVLAAGFLLYGIRVRRHEWRLASLALMLTTVGKVFLFDTSGLTGLWRIGSFVALGISLIGIGWLYSRQLRADTAEPASSGG